MNLKGNVVNNGSDKDNEEIITVRSERHLIHCLTMRTESLIPLTSGR